MLGEKINKKITNNNKIIEILLSGLNIAIFLLVLNIISNNIFIFEQKILTLISLYLIVGIIFINIRIKKIVNIYRQKNKKILQTSIGIVLLLITFLSMIFSNNIMILLISISILIISLDIILQSYKERRKELRILSITSIIYTFFYILLLNVPIIWVSIQKFSLFFTQEFGSIIGRETQFGPSTSGIWILIIFIIFNSTAFLISKRKIKYFIFEKIGLFIIWIIFLTIISLINFESNFEIVRYQIIMVIFGLIPTYFYLSKIKISEIKININKKKIKKSFTSLSILISVFLLLSTVTITVFPADNNKTDEDSTILFYAKNMLGSWDVPEYGKYGKASTGMFGSLPYYLNLSGFNTKLVVENLTSFMNINYQNTSSDLPEINISDVLNVNQSEIENITSNVNNTILRYINITDYSEIIESEIITDDILNEIDVFVVINLNVSFSNEELNVIRNYLKNGGSLLVLGDHTDIGGMMDPLNSLVSTYGIRYRFDSALPIDQHFKWQPCYQLMYHPSTFKVRDNHLIEISVGSCLDIETGTNPIIIGRYGLSDEGNRLNSDGAYLGDYEYTAGEQIGDIILAAESYYGDGKIIAFGDTSSFQNSAIAYSYPMLHSIFSSLAGPTTNNINIIQVALSIVFLIISILLSFYLIKQEKIFVIIPIFILIGLVFTNAFNPVVIGDQEISGNIFYIDSSHKEKFNNEPYQDDSISGVVINILRNNYLPLLMEKFDIDKIKKSEMLLLNSPTQKFANTEVQDLMEYINQGGLVILATGYEDKEASMPILNEFNLDIEEIPLGPVPYVEQNPEEYQLAPRFVDSWPIIIGDQENTMKFYNITIIGEEYVLMTFTKHGDGGLLLIADSMFLYDENIESLMEYWPGNIQFIKNIIDELKEKEVLS